MDTQVLTATESDWASCLWVLPRLQSSLVASGAICHRSRSWLNRMSPARFQEASPFLKLGLPFLRFPVSGDHGFHYHQGVH